MKRHAPPTFACWLLASVLPGMDREAMLGDLIEEYGLRVDSTSPFKASRWFWGQVCRSFPSIVWSLLWSGRLLISANIALGVYILMATLKLSTELMIAKLAAPGETARVILAPILFLATAAVGGCVAARIRYGTTLVLATMVLITVVVLIRIKICSVPVPWWYQFGFLTLGPLAVILAPAVLGALKTGTRSTDR